MQKEEESSSPVQIVLLDYIKYKSQNTHFTINFLRLTAKHRTGLCKCCMIASSKRGGKVMKINVDISSEYKEPYAVIYTNEVTEDIQRILDTFGSKEIPVIALQSNGDMVILQPSEIYMVRVENGETMIYTEKKSYRSRKRLYEVGQQLGTQFMQISKSTLVNLYYMDSIEPGFSGTLLLKLKNGCKDYVSRTYLPEFKKYLGL